MSSPNLLTAIHSNSKITLRLLAYIIAIVLLYDSLPDQDFNSWLIKLMPFLLAFPSLTFKVILQERNSWPNRAIACADALILGMITGFMQSAPLNALAMLIIANHLMITRQVGMNWLISTGILWVAAILTTLSLAKSPTDLLPQSSEYFTAVFCLLIYTTVLSYFSRNEVKRLLVNEQELAQLSKEKTVISKRLSRYLPPQVWGAVFSNKKNLNLETQRKKLCIFFSDIKSFAEITEDLQPEALTELLNNYFTEMSAIAQRYGGTIDKFIGDAILIFFGDPKTRGTKEDTIACVSMAIEMRKRMKVFRQQWHHRGITKPLHIRMGIHSGYCTVGNFGAETRMDYTVIGKEVNLASRLESYAEPDQICISNETYQLVKESILCRNKGSLDVKGFAKPVGVHEVIDFRKDLGATQSFVQHEHDGFLMYLDINKIKQDQDMTNKVIEALEKSARQLKAQRKREIL